MGQHTSNIVRHGSSFPDLELCLPIHDRTLLCKVGPSAHTSPVIIGLGV